MRTERTFPACCAVTALAATKPRTIAKASKGRQPVVFICLSFAVLEAGSAPAVRALAQARVSAGQSVCQDGLLRRECSLLRTESLFDSERPVLRKADLESQRRFHVFHGGACPGCGPGGPRESAR